MSAIGSSVAGKRKSLFDSPNRTETSIRACGKFIIHDDSNMRPDDSVVNLTKEDNFKMYATGSSVAGKRKSLFDSPNRTETSIRACGKFFVHDDSRMRPDDSLVDLTKEDNFKMSATGSSVAGKRKSLFDSPNRTETSIRACAKTSCNTVKDPRQPCFKPSLLGSPFYPGRTMYGGASASYVNQPNIKLRRNTQVNETSTTDNTVSHSTQRIMDLLEHYSSPLNEARRIPQYTRPSRNNSLSSSFSTSPPSNKTVSYKTQELHVPSIASILRLKKRSRLMDTTTAARQLIASHSSTADTVPYPAFNTHREKEQTTETEPSNKLTTKVKSRLTRPKRGESADLETEMPAPVNLPSATLQIDTNNLPKFSFGTPPSAPASKPPAPAFTNSTPIQTKPTETSRKPDVVTSANPFKFASPVRIPAAEQPNATPPKFTFGSPERGIDQTKNKDDVPCVVGASEEKSAAKEKDWQCADCWVNNKPDKQQCVCCGGKKPAPNTDTSSKPAPKCTVCKLTEATPLKDKCVNCEKIKINNVIKPLTKPDDSSKWKCGDCWVSNDSSADACVCCGAKNPNKTTAAKPNAIASDKADSEWKCEDCWIKNKSNVDKCVACGGSKPGAKSSTTPAPTGGFFSSPLPKPPDNAFKNIVKKQTDKWECPSCLVRNDGDKNRCVCCETEREGTTSEAAKKSFNFGMNPNTTFKFGIDPKAQTPAAKPAEAVTTTESKKEESETNNNVLSKTPSFTFGLPAKKTEDQTDSAKKVEEKTDSAPKVNFTFGIPKTAATPATEPATPAFTAPKPAEKPAEEEKPQEVPKIPTFTVPIAKTPPKPIGNIFSPPIPASQTSLEKSMATPIVPEKPVAAPLILNSSVSAEKKDPPSNPLLAQPAATSAPAAPQATATFSFGSGGGLKLASNLFAAPATTATTSSSITFGTPLQSAPTSAPSMFQTTENKTAPVVSPFGKTDATVPLFQKPEAPATTSLPAPAPAPAATPAPMFSFGSSMSQPQPAAEKPKFNFTFGSTNKTETPSLFKPPENKLTFGAPMENKFALPTSNALGTNSITNSPMGNGLPSITSPGNGLPNPLSTGTNMVHNPLAGGNGLPSSNTLGQSGGIFGSNVQKDSSMWPSSNNSSNMFTSGNSSLQKPSGFTFGATSTPFNATSPPAFGASQPTNVFGMNQSSNQSQPSMFATPSQPSVFGSPQAAAAPTMGMFGSPQAAAPTFGTPNQSIPTFEAPSLTPAPAPAFNFGGQQQATGIFGFGQHGHRAQLGRGDRAGPPHAQGRAPLLAAMRPAPATAHARRAPRAPRAAPTQHPAAVQATHARAVSRSPWAVKLLGIDTEIEVVRSGRRFVFPSP
ncbi:hypothetical protein NE865_07294 [Phthorimaea operculella]|nr:hypothetical protein NE865_07294 [Phthorimaea operculella]